METLLFLWFASFAGTLLSVIWASSNVGLILGLGLINIGIAILIAGGAIKAAIENVTKNN